MSPTSTLPAIDFLTSTWWGRADILFTPAYWKDQLLHWGTKTEARGHRLGETLQQEVVACLLGGYGIPAEVGVAAFRNLHLLGLIQTESPRHEHLRRALSEPITLPNGRVVRYRFARSKAEQVCALLSQWHDPSPSLAGRSLRNWLLQFNGIGPKTASWIVRNWSDSDEIAILDVHVIRAGLLARFFSSQDRVDRDYLAMEDQFLSFCRAIGGRPSVVDAIIWTQMKFAGRIAHCATGRYNPQSLQSTFAA